jgi:hypothetical protein
MNSPIGRGMASQDRDKISSVCVCFERNLDCRDRSGGLLIGHRAGTEDEYDRKNDGPPHHFNCRSPMDSVNE